MAFGSATTGYEAGHEFQQPAAIPDFWQFSDVELAQCCVLVAESRSGQRNAPVRAEAMRLFLMWRGAIQAKRVRGSDYERGTVLLESLRKRTIQILVRLSLQGLLFAP
jgi:hypothetical protein